MKNTLQQDAFRIRKVIITALHASGGGHYGGALSVVDILLVLYKKILNIHSQLHENEKDKLILSKGHAAIALYAVLANIGLLNEHELSGYGQINRGLEGHPDMLLTKGVDFSSGSLGQGVSVGLGMALAKKNAHIWVVVGDGECQEGQIWEAAILAARYKVSNLHVIIDSNGAQEFGYKYNKNLAQEPLSHIEEKWRSFGWHVQCIDGHNIDELHNSFSTAVNIQHSPSVIIARTQKGYGVKLFTENPERFHCIHLTAEEYTTAFQGIEENAPTC